MHALANLVPVLTSAFVKAHCDFRVIGTAPTEVPTFFFMTIDFVHNMVRVREHSVWERTCAEGVGQSFKTGYVCVCV